MAARRKARREFGNVRRTSAGNYAARYRDPNDRARWINAPAPFASERLADDWLLEQRVALMKGQREAVSTETLRDYAARWLVSRPKPLDKRTRDHYVTMLTRFILPLLGHKQLREITPTTVRNWFAVTATDTPAYRSQAYGLLAAIMKTAEDDDLIVKSPCRIRGAATNKRKTVTRIAELSEIEAIVRRVPERYKLMILLAAWCAMRFGELIELRRADIDLKAGVIRVRRGAVWTKGGALIDDIDNLTEAQLSGGEQKTHAEVGAPKTEAGKRDIDIPPHLIGPIREHLKQHCDGTHSLLFPAAKDAEKHMRPSTLYKVYYPAREMAGRPDLRFHDLRHTGATLFAQTGATTAELMDRIGHSTSQAAMRYQHAARSRMSKLAEGLSAMAAAEAQAVND